MDTQISEWTDNYLRMALLCLYLTRVKAVSLPPEGALMSSLESLLLLGPWASNPGPLLATTPLSAPRFLVVHKTFSVGLHCTFEQSSWTGFKMALGQHAF